MSGHDAASGGLHLEERSGVAYVRLPTAPRVGPIANRLAWSLVDLCASLRERQDLLCAVALVGAPGPFALEAPRDGNEHDRLSPAWPEAVNAVGGLDFPTVAALDGPAEGPAWELALACDLRIAVRGARVGSPEVRWGRLPSAGGTQRLARVAGEPLALRLLLLGELLGADEARSLGLLHRTVADGALAEGLEELLDVLRGGAPVALGYTREAVRAAADLPLDAGLRLEADLAALLQTTADRWEGIEAFLRRRPARFVGR